MQKIPHSASEPELLRLIAAGDQHAYRLIFERYWDAVYSTALLLTKSAALAEDIAQDVFTVLWEKRAGLGEVSRLEGFLFITARNLVYTRFRKLASSQEYRQYILHCFPDTAGAGADEKAELKELEQTILRTIQQLPPQQQKAFRLSRFQGMRHEEIATAMGVSRITIKSYIVQAIAALRKALANHPSEALILLWALSFLQ
ncbi:RNA polymerase sigma factor [Chitinophaga japonensis]|uniref:RNA polymerase sigma-70 factor (ECF subfamily) n=1 Tax=Chitinophaga japonensis TaxID=104662 RepID=A0A562SI96_CHIJA|nr:RNA polymerase sigma-70 factor [Chitinophaga japonensis]TWI81007.1 RNA polymerase sigma-70 factor (ECF subfamily) [Chitinophaga japonensis]